MKMAVLCGCVAAAAAAGSEMVIMTRSLLFLLSVPWLAGAAETAVQQRARIEVLENSLLAPCCYAEPVSRHQSEAAAQMKVEIARWVSEGKSNQQIIGAYIERYGQKVYAPPKPPGLWVRLVPWLALLAGGGAIVLWLRKMTAHRPAVA